MNYNDNNLRPRIYGQPKDVIDILQFLFPDYTIISDNADDLYKQAIPDFIIDNNKDWQMRLEWQEMHIVHYNNKMYLPVKETKVKYIYNNPTSSLINFNRKSWLAYFITYEDIIHPDNFLDDLYNHKEEFKKWNEHKMAMFIDIARIRQYAIPCNLFEKKNIKIIPCPSQSLSKTDVI